MNLVLMCSVIFPSEKLSCRHFIMSVPPILGMLRSMIANRYPFLHKQFWILLFIVSIACMPSYAYIFIELYRTYCVRLKLQPCVLDLYLFQYYLYSHYIKVVVIDNEDIIASAFLDLFFNLVLFSK
jgi:hypothetical protein